MTRALKTKNILKSLLKGLMTTERLENYVVEHNLFCASKSTSFEHLSATGLRNPVDSAHGDSIMNAENITSNSWTSVKHSSSLLGPRTMQWVHMVCGLWTPGTKCPNATTMSAFDVSGASPAKRNTVSSIHSYSDHGITLNELFLYLDCCNSFFIRHVQYVTELGAHLSSAEM